MSKYSYQLVVGAHPDDEILFFSGPLLQRKNIPWKVVCITDGNADGMGEKRLADFKRACSTYKIKEYERWNYLDIYQERLDVEKLVADLKSLASPKRVYTHSIIGDYGHPHHQDVSYAVHRAFHGVCPVLSVAHNCYPQEKYLLTPSQYKKKTQVLTGPYASEFNRFAHLLPCHCQEGFVKIGISEIENIYGFLIGKEKLKPSKLKHYLWLVEHLEQVLSRPRGRLF